MLLSSPSASFFMTTIGCHYHVLYLFYFFIIYFFFGEDVKQDSNDGIRTDKIMETYLEKTFTYFYCKIPLSMHRELELFLI